METSDFAKNLCFSASALYRIVNRVATQETSFTGLTPSYAFVIIAVNEKPGIRMTELSSKLFLEISTVTRLIEKLEAKNYVIRDSSPGITQVYLTELGNQVYDNILVGINRYNSVFKSMLGKKKSKELSRTVMAAAEELKAVPEE